MSSYSDLQAYDAELLAAELGDHDTDGNPLTASYRRASDGQLLTLSNVLTWLTPQEKQGEDKGRTTADEIEVHVPRAQLETVAEGQDTIKLTLPGDPTAAKYRPVARIIDADRGFWYLAVGR